MFNIKVKFFQSVSLPTLLFLLMGILFSTGLTQQYWQDGFPLFLNIATRNYVQVDSLIKLQARYVRYNAPESFPFILNGVDWKWPLNSAPLGLPAAEDIDFRVSQGYTFYIVADGTGHRILELNPNPTEPVIVWEFYSPNSASDNYLKYPVAVSTFEEGLSRKYVITDKLTHRVLIVNRETKVIEWAYGDKTPGDGPNQLNYPSDAIVIPNSTRVLICDQGNNRVLMVDRIDKSIPWQWGGSVGGTLKVPVDIEYISQLNSVLITDQKNHRVILVNIISNEVTYQFGTGQPETSALGLNNPTDADWLQNGHIMICDSSNKRLLEVDEDKNIIWQFHRPLNGLIDADRLPDNRTLIITDDEGIRNRPLRLGYANDSLVSKVHDLNYNVIFDSLFLNLNKQTDTTNIRLQIRSASQIEDLSTEDWYGPTGTNDFYTQSITRINPIHTGDHKFQFRVFMDTQDFLYTPRLNSVQVSHHYYDTDSTGMVTSTVISVPSNQIVTAWDSLTFQTIIPASPADRQNVHIQLQIMDAIKNIDLVDPIAISPLVEKHVVRLSENSNWKGKGVQSIRLKAKLFTSFSSITPILKNWRGDFFAMTATPSKIAFVNNTYTPVKYYNTAPPMSENDPNFKFVDLVRVKLQDSNLALLQDNIRLTIRVRGGQDSAVVFLVRQATGEFINLNGMRAFISRFPDPGDNTFQVSDRDYLEVRYRDPLDPNDVSTAQVLMVQNSQAKLEFLNRLKAPITEASINDTVFVRVTDEKDQDFSAAQDTIYVEIFDNKTTDNENLMLLETLDSLGTYSSGEFFSTPGIRLISSATGFPTDGRIQTLPGNQIGARYDDNFMPDPVVTLLIRQTSDTTKNTQITKLYEFLIAPNPFFKERHSQLRLRAGSAIGELTLKKVEIFNIAGERVRTISGESIFPAPLPEKQAGFMDAWWDLKNESGQLVSSGTYWVKFSADLLNTRDQKTQAISELKKILIIY